MAAKKFPQVMGQNFLDHQAPGDNLPGSSGQDAGLVLSKESFLPLKERTLLGGAKLPPPNDPEMPDG